MTNSLGSLCVWSSCTGNKGALRSIAPEVTTDLAKWAYARWLPAIAKVNAAAALFWCLGGTPDNQDLDFDALTAANRQGVPGLTPAKIRKVLNLVGDACTGIAAPGPALLSGNIVKVISYHGMIRSSEVGGQRFYAGTQWGRLTEDRLERLVQDEICYYQGVHNFEIVQDAGAGEELHTASDHVAKACNVFGFHHGTEAWVGPKSWLASRGGNCYVLSETVRKLYTFNFSDSWGAIRPEALPANVKINVLIEDAARTDVAEIREWVRRGFNVFLDLDTANLRGDVLRDAVYA